MNPIPPISLPNQAEPNVASPGRAASQRGGIPRRSFVTGLAAGAVAALAPIEPASAQEAGSLRGTFTLNFNPGFFQVPLAEQGIIAVLIGLLLPAVQKIRSAPRLVLFDSAGKAYPIVLPEGDGEGPVPAYFRLSNRFDDNQRVVVVDGPGAKGLEIPTADGILIALLLPAVQADGKLGGMIAGSVQLFGDGSVRQILPYIEQDNLFRSDRGASPCFLGPYLTTPEQTVQISILLPVPIKQRRPPILLVFDSVGGLVARDAIPTDPGAPTVAAYEITTSRDSIRIQDGEGRSLPIRQQLQPDGILIALLLPAVQRASTSRDTDQTVGPLGGSLITPHATVALHLSAPTPGAL